MAKAEEKATDTKTDYVAKGNIAYTLENGKRSTIFAGESIPKSMEKNVESWIERGIVMTKAEADKIKSDAEAAEAKAKKALKR